MSALDDIFAGKHSEGEPLTLAKLDEMIAAIEMPKDYSWLNPSDLERIEMIAGRIEFENSAK